ncbi:Hypothetical predicted protein [Mytilus galloprovincialis]|uniref:Uncharacterized protein n=1 Tax=Mytilus galloprovincialis TaxID=29158 RepID=A0A8B6GKM9_MYTGA|nr:Hypothetical predicted protein [Mytilus galloprovincialis]
MLQSVFEGKAAEIYSALPSEKSSDYDTVKQEVLKAYELVPEAYRQKFRSYKNTLECPASQAFKSSFCDYMEEYKPFMSDGFVSIVDDTLFSLFKILRDTGASQSLLLEGVLPLSEKTSVGASVLLHRCRVRLYRCSSPSYYLKSDLITGPVVVGVRPNLPVEVVTLLLGNDLARNKVVAELLPVNRWWMLNHLKMMLNCIQLVLLLGDG